MKKEEQKKSGETVIKLSTMVAIASIVVVLMLAVSGFTFAQSDQISRHDVRIGGLEQDFSEIKEIRKDISAIKVMLARLAVILEQKLK